MLVHHDGEEYVVFGTGGQSSGGGLYVVPFASLMDMKDVKVLYRNPYKGILSPPELVDINKDGSEDIVVALFNSSVLAFDGLSFKPLWNFSFPMSESFSPPTPAYFNDDDIPDFLVQYNAGPGFPTYFYSQMVILDGRTGAPLLDPPVLHTIGSQAPGVTISLGGFGNDFLLYWAADCVGNEGVTEPFSFLPGSSVRAQNSADLCRQRFNSTTVSRLYALSRHVSPPGVVIYSSEERKALEYNNTVNATVEVEQYLASHPELRDTYGADGQQQTEPPARSPSSFRHKEEESVLVGERGRARQEVDKRPSHDPWRPHQEPWYPQSPDYELAYPVGDDEYSSRRDKRSRGPRLTSGIPRLTSTGVLVAPLERMMSDNGIDIVFVTYWLPPSADAQVLSPAAKKCIEKKQSLTSDTDTYEPLTAALRECAGARAAARTPNNGLEVPMGQMTVYRLHVTCSCLAAGSCVPILPAEQQSWQAYLGRDGRVTFSSRYS